ncbi:hypothetical protein MNAN1_002300 [Malassezia nana]|uniref:MICOS complex subunit n=1 Tax=Malassezia nana TaxID=180528 RepID=A0AAF0EK99_9BASI|nr:hypothetical protein MNAN1_002300 [Malassezia nana]
MAPTPTFVVETTTELERQISKLRQTVQKYTGAAFRSVRSGVDSVVDVENRVENRMSKLVSDKETLTPNGLYVGVATLASMVFTRYRSFPIRWFVPPVVFAASMKYFLPLTSDNLCEYYEEKEQRFAPQFSEARRSQWQKLQQYWYTGVDHLKMTGDKVGSLFSAGVKDMEKSTGLKIATLLPQEAKTLQEKVATPENSAKKLI